MFDARFWRDSQAVVTVIAVYRKKKTLVGVSWFIQQIHHSWNLFTPTAIADAVCSSGRQIKP
jgi:hypothetical protein